MVQTRLGKTRRWLGSVGRIVGRTPARAGLWLLLSVGAPTLVVGCTDNSGNGHFIPPGSTGGAGGAGGGTGGDSAGGSGGDGAGGNGGGNAGGAGRGN